jgi:beta-galactosidase
VLEPSTAAVVAQFTNTAEHTPAVTLNKFGKGNAIYLATESNPSTVEPLMTISFQ